LRGGNELSLTQEDIAAILGVRRTSVTVVARTLQQAGMIKYARGHIRLLDIPALQETACECYQAIKSNYDALIQPDGNQAVLSPTLAPAGGLTASNSCPLLALSRHPFNVRFWG
jgi:hypothetical protein